MFVNQVRIAGEYIGLLTKNIRSGKRQIDPLNAARRRGQMGRRVDAPTGRKEVFTMEDGNPPGSLSPLLAGRLLPEPKGSSHANELSQTDLNSIA